MSWSTVIVAILHTGTLEWNWRFLTSCWSDESKVSLLTTSAERTKPDDKKKK